MGSDMQAGAELAQMITAAKHAIEDLGSLRRILSKQPNGSIAWGCGNLAERAEIDLRAALLAVAP